MKNDSQFSYNREPQDQGFYVTAKGRLFIRKHYTGLIPVVGNKKEYEQIIDQLQVEISSKKYLKRLRDKLVGKTEDKIIDTILTELIERSTIHGPVLLRLLIALLHQAGQQHH